MVLHSVEGPSGSVADEAADVDADAGFFEMSPASAEQVTIQIRSMMERAWEYIAIAYQGRAHLALGYASWDEYVDDRVGDLRLTVPHQERGAVVQSLSRAQMSLWAIAKVLGVDVATVYRALVRTSPRPQLAPRNQRRFVVVTASAIRAGTGRPLGLPRSAVRSTRGILTSVRGTCSPRGLDRARCAGMAVQVRRRMTEEHEEVVEVKVPSDHPEEADL